ncbi:MFS general substrate transporter [Neoconidiobolus thromboides FSU 785]|nr:MFS general substrate transporter [Neoconidiobolus thromboides FSU 785]
MSEVREKEFNINNADLDIKTDSDSEREKQLSNKKWIYKALALFCAIFFSAGSHFATNTINSLKEHLKKEQGLDNTQYGAAQSAVYLINTIMPLLGGIFMDRFGTASGSVLSSSLILLGNIIIAISSHVNSFPMIIVGRIIHGLGSGIIVVAQETILGKWFSTSIMASVIGLQIGSSRLFSFLAQGTVPSLAESTGFYGNGLWLSVGICGISWIATLIYAFILRRAGGEHISEKAKKSSFSIRRLLYLPVGFWVMPFTIFFLGGVWTPFLGSVAEFVSKTYGTTATGKLVSQEVKAWTSSVALIVPVVLSPVSGGFIDAFGYRSIYVVASAILTIISIGMLAWSTVSIYVGLTLFSLALTIGPVALTSSVPLLLPPELVGTGIGVHKVGLSVGVALFHLVLGHVQDITPRGEYYLVMDMLFVVSCLSLVMACVYVIYNRRFIFSLFDVPAKRRRNLIEKHHGELPVTQKLENSRSNIWRKSLVVLMTLFVLISWILFIWSLVENPIAYFKRFKL